MADYDPYNEPPSRPAPRHVDPFRVMSREQFPREGDRRRRRDAGPQPFPHSAPSTRHLPAIGEATTERGVWEEEAPFSGVRSFVLVRADGSRLLEISIDAAAADPRMIAWLWRVLEAKDPRPALQVI